MKKDLLNKGLGVRDVIQAFDEFDDKCSGVMTYPVRAPPRRRPAPRLTPSRGGNTDDACSTERCAASGRPLPCPCQDFKRAVTRKLGMRLSRKKLRAASRSHAHASSTVLAVHFRQTTSSWRPPSLHMP